MRTVAIGAISLIIGLLSLPRGDSEWSVRVTPAEFFTGDLKRLKGHLDFRSAVCFKIKIQGDGRAILLSKCGVKESGLMWPSTVSAGTMSQTN
jgi:hypothetical protein